MWNFFKRNKPKQQTEIQDDYSDEDNDDIVREPNKVAERILGLFAVIGKVHKNDEKIKSRNIYQLTSVNSL